MPPPGPRYAVRTDRLRAVADALADAVTAAAGVADHPGVVRGRAQDAGDDELRDQAAAFADRWEHGLHLMVGHGRRMSDALRSAADGYDRVEALVRADAGR